MGCTTLNNGDEVPITGIGKSWAQQMVVMSWSSMVGFGTTNEAQFLIYGLFEKLRAISQDVEKDTLNRFFTMLAWSLRWLLRGQWPDRDVDGLKFLGCSSWLAFLQLIPKKGEGVKKNGHTSYIQEGKTPMYALFSRDVCPFFLGSAVTNEQKLQHLAGDFPLELVPRKRPPQVSRIHCFPHILAIFL